MPRVAKSCQEPPRVSKSLVTKTLWKSFTILVGLLSSLKLLGTLGNSSTWLGSRRGPGQAARVSLPGPGAGRGPEAWAWARGRGPGPGAPGPGPKAGDCKLPFTRMGEDPGPRRSRSPQGRDPGQRGRGSASGGLGPKLPGGRPTNNVRPAQGPFKAAISPCRPKRNSNSKSPRVPSAQVVARQPI